MSNVGKENPRNLEEAVKILLSNMTDKERELIKNSTEEELINLHFGLGVNIRNKFGLWDENFELLITCGELDPDAASTIIIRTLWEKLRQE